MPSSPTPTPVERLLLVGILGGVASGKSSVARGLAGGDGPVLEADALAHEVLASPEGAAFVRERFGPDYLGDDGLPDRGALGRLAFDPAAGAAARRALEDWIHPRVRARIFERLDEARVAGARLAVLDVPLLLENDAQHGLASACDVLVFVDVDPETRDARARSSRGWSTGEVARREAAQLPLTEKRARADHVIPNNGTSEELAEATRALRARLLQD